MLIFDNFEAYMMGIINLNGNNLQKTVINLSDKMFNLIFKPNQTEVAKINLSHLVKGRFYMILYNYNGNKIWCPIFALDWKIVKNKPILFAINLEYLPPKYKIQFFGKIFNFFKSDLNRFEFNEFVRKERPLKKLTFELVYKSLQDMNGMEYCVTAYDIFKIKKAYLVSYKIAPEILMCNCKKYNSQNMKELFIKSTGEEHIKIGKILEEFEQLILQYQTDSKEYHEKLKLFEQHLKLYKND